jgi:hypothetical protein
MRIARFASAVGVTAIAGAALMSPSVARAASGGARSVAIASHKGILPPKNPSRSLPPLPNFFLLPSCAHGKDGSRCNTAILRAIARARRRLEKMTGMSFSLAAYLKLRPIEQIFVAANLERIARGLPPAVVLTRSLDRIAQAGANADTDPLLRRVPDPLPGGGRPAGLGGNWAGGWDNALGADYGWMYDDGLHSPNVDCTRAHPRGCWGHRDNILGTFASRLICAGRRHELAMGAGHVRSGKRFGDSETQLFVGVCGPTPTDVVLTWRKAMRLLHVKV